MAGTAESASRPGPPDAPEGDRVVTVVDCGSTAIRAYVVELEGARHRILEDLSRPVDLTTGIHHHRLHRTAMDRLVMALRSILAVADGYGSCATRVVATSALREAANRDVVIEDVRQRVGVEIEVIDSAEEARCYFQAIGAVFREERRRPPSPLLMMDVGSGTTSVSLIQQGRLVASVDEHFGTARVVDQFGDLIADPEFCPSMERFTGGATRMVLSRLHRTRPRALAVTGEEVRELRALVQPDAEGPLAVLERGRLDAWWAKILAADVDDRFALCGRDSEGAARMMLVAAMLRNLCEETGIDTITVPDIRLRDGLVVDFKPGSAGPHHLDRRTLLAAARKMSRVFGMEVDYAQNTAALAEQLFDQTRGLHHLGERERTLLAFAALVHDVGAYLNVRNRHKHTLYVIRAADIAGLSAEEKEIVAHVARYHRRSPPMPHHHEFQALPRKARIVVTHLAALLRVAYALDVERTQRIRRIDCRIGDGRFLIATDRRQVSLERWAMEGKSEMFEEAFGLEVAVLPREERA